MSRLKRISINLGLIVAGLTMGLAIFYVVMRVAGLTHPPFYTYDYYRGWKLRPGTSGWQEKEGEAFVRINQQGFRGPEVSAAKPANTVRIAVLGDSFTEGQQVPEDQTFCAVAQRALAKCPALGGRKIETLNFGVNGYGTAQELMALRRQVWQFAPDIVVLAVFTGNDIVNNSATLEGEKCRPFFVYRDDRLVLGGPMWDSSFARLKCLARFETRMTFDTHRFEGLSWINRASTAVRDSFRAVRYGGKKPHGGAKQRLVGSETGLSDSIYAAPGVPVWRDAWRVTEGEIALMHQEVSSKGAAFLVVTLSNGIQVNPDPAVRQNYMRAVGATDLFYPDERIKALGDRDGFPVLNLARPLQAYAEAHHAYLHGFRNTEMGAGHWNALGDQVGGDLIAKKLCELIAGAPVVGKPQRPAR